MLNRIAVLGLGFGDEGKGRVVDYLCTKTENPVVIRFSGGPQAAHHVMLDNETSHVFAHFGSGTLRGVKTIWSEYCPVNPISMWNEHDVLKKLGYQPKIAIHGKCPIITPYEIAWNYNDKPVIEHGSCGMGIFATKLREEANWSILFEDLYHPEVFQIKIDNLWRFYYQFLASYQREEIEVLYEACQWIRKNSNIELYYDSDQQCLSKNTIFEGSQGLLLDQNHGFFPHVTPSNTGLDNINEGIDEVWLVTRAYQTRHGAGPMSPIVEHKIDINPYEKNGNNGIQGEFRRTILDLDMIRYALQKHQLIRHKYKTLVITCMDLLNNYQLFDNGKIINCSLGEFINKIQEATEAEKVYLSWSPIGDLDKI